MLLALPLEELLRCMERLEGCSDVEKHRNLEHAAPGSEPERFGDLAATGEGRQCVAVDQPSGL